MSKVPKPEYDLLIGSLILLVCFTYVAIMLFSYCPK